MTGREKEPTRILTEIKEIESDNITGGHVEAVGPSGRTGFIDGELAISIAQMQQTLKPTE